MSRRIAVAVAAAVLVAGVVAGVGQGPTPAAAAPPGPVRYVDEVFTEVVETAGLPFAEAIDADGVTRTLRLDLFEPAGDTADDRPAVILLSGGGFTSANKDSALITRWARALARRGLVAVSIDYRTDDDESPLALFAGIERAVEDLRAAARWLRANQATGGHAEDFPLAGPGASRDLGIDPDRISAGGYSAGAVTSISASWREVIHPDERDPGEPDFDPIVNTSNEGWSWEISAAVSAAGAGLGGPDAGDPPLLMAHGDLDARVAYDETIGENYGSLGFSGAETCARARAYGMDCIFRTFPGVAHGLFDGGAREQVLHADHVTFLSCRVGAEGPFVDVDGRTELAAGWAARAGVLTVPGDARFRPAVTMARAPFLRMLWRLAGSPTGFPPHRFRDVPASLDAPARWAAASRVVAVPRDRRFRPSAPVRRLAAARMLHATAGAPRPGGLPDHGLSDVPANGDGPVRWLVAPRPVQLLAGGGIGAGFANGTFRPTAPLPRGTAARWVHGLALAGTAWNAGRQLTPPPTVCFRLGDP